jgi:hypothetical protein
MRALNMAMVLCATFCVDGSNALLANFAQPPMIRGAALERNTKLGQSHFSSVKLGALSPLGVLESPLAKTLLSSSVPLLPAASLNVVLFSLFSKKLLKNLTPSGFVHAMGLGTGLWMTLGWKGWTYCVLYLVLGSVVTKIRFEEKQKRGLAEGRGGRRGPENVWYVLCKT